MQAKEGITKRQSTMLQGIAILLMMFHHFFLVMDGCPFRVVHPEWVLKFAWFGKICVSIFAFVSGYGMYYVMQRVEKVKFFDSFGKEFKISIHKIISLYLKFWLILFLTKGIDLFFYQEEINPLEFIKNMFTISLSYNGSLWYLPQYIQMMILLPFLDLFFTFFYEKKEQNKKRILYISCVAAVLLLTLIGRIAYRPLWEFLKQLPQKLRIEYTVVFIIGYLISKYEVFQKINDKVEKQPVWLQFFEGVLLTMLMVWSRIQIATDAAYTTFDFAMTPVLVYGLVMILKYCRITGKILYFMGSCSTYMWFLHGWIYVKTAIPMVYMNLHVLQFYLLQVCINFALAFALVAIGKEIKKIRGK